MMARRFVMKKLWTDRRLACAFAGMVLLFVLGMSKSADVAASIAAICLGIAGANAAEGVFKKEKPGE